MECLSGAYQVKSEVATEIWEVETIPKIYIAKRTQLYRDPVLIERFIQELGITFLMSNHNIAPLVIEYWMCDQQTKPTEVDTEAEAGIIIMEKLDGDIKKLWPFIGSMTRSQIIAQVTTLVTQMHELDIAHGDLHSGNIGYKEGEKGLTIRLLDFGEAFYISTGYEDSRVIDWIEGNFSDFEAPLTEEGYYNFTQYDFTNWQEGLRGIPVPKDWEFKGLFSPDIISTYLEGDCGALALSLQGLSGWPIYSISTEGGIPAHYVVRAPGGEFFLDITGLRSRSYLKNYWTDYFDGEKIIIHPVDALLCNSNYYRDIQASINSDLVNQIATRIWQEITPMLNY